MRRDARTTTFLVAAVILLAPLHFADATATPFGDTPQAFGDHVKVSFRLATPVGDPTGVLGVEGPSGEVVMYAYTYNDQLYVTDGNDGAGDPNPDLRVSERYLSSTWHRLDVILHGSTFTLHLDQRETITARTSTQATAGTWIDDPRPLPDPRYHDVEWVSRRVDDDGMANDETFGSYTTRWEVIQGSGAVDLRSDWSGHHAVGRLEVRALRAPGPPPLDANYVRAPLIGFGGTYSAEVAVSISSIVLPPVGQAVLSGLSGPAATPRVHWAIIEEPDPASDQEPRHPLRWHLVLLDPAGERHGLSPSWLDTAWHTGHTRVDEAAGRLEITVDAGTTQVVDGLALGTSTHVGTGDIFATPVPSGWGIGQHDELAVYQQLTP